MATDNSLELAEGIKTTNPAPADWYYRPIGTAGYADVAAACAAVPVPVRIGRTVLIAGLGEHAWGSDTSNAGLLPKAGGSGPGTSYTLPQASTTTLGGVKSMGAGLTGNVTVNSDGSMTAPAGDSGPAVTIEQSLASGSTTAVPSTAAVKAATEALSAAIGTKASSSALAAKADLTAGKVPLTQLPGPVNRLCYNFPPGQSTTYEVPIVFLDQAGTYNIELQTNATPSSTLINGTPVAPPYSVVVGDVLAIVAQTPAGLSGYIILRTV